MMKTRPTVNDGKGSVFDEERTPPPIPPRSFERVPQLTAIPESGYRQPPPLPPRNHKLQERSVPESHCSNYEMVSSI